MRAPEEYFDEDMQISPREFQLGMTLYFLAKDNLQVTRSHKDLSSLMGVSSEVIRQATLGLVQKGLLQVERKRRNRGFLSYNKFILCADVDVRMREFREKERAAFLKWKYSDDGRKVHYAKNYVAKPAPKMSDTKTGTKAELNFLIKKWTEENRKRYGEWEANYNPWNFGESNT